MRLLLSERPRSVKELIAASLPKASVYYDIKRMLRSGEIESFEDVGGELRYRLVEATILPSGENFRLIAEKLEDANKNVAREAMADLEAISKHSVINDKRLIKTIIEKIQTSNPDPILFSVLRHQALLVKSKHELRPYQAVISTAERLVVDQKHSVKLREDALLFLQIVDDNKLPELAFKVISTPDKALDQGTQFGIVIENICINAARQEKWRRQLYDLLLSKDRVVTERTKSVLQQSRRPPFITSHP